jgi:phospholipid transport system transporter-binding protein
MRLADGVAYLEGNLTQAEAAALLREGEAAVGQGCQVFDLAGARQLDSAALSLLLCWRRRAQAQGRPLGFRNVPESLSSLASLYGVSDLLNS